jgi:hypothetical protein
MTINGVIECIKLEFATLACVSDQLGCLIAREMCVRVKTIVSLRKVKVLQASTRSEEEGNEN